MLKLKTTFYLYPQEMSEKMKKSITDKFIEQAARCILADITAPGKPDDMEENRGNEEGMGENTNE